MQLVFAILFIGQCNSNFLTISFFLLIRIIRSYELLMVSEILEKKGNTL